MFDKYHSILQISGIILLVFGVHYITPSFIAVLFPVLLVVFAVCHSPSIRPDSQQISNSESVTKTMLRPSSSARNHSTPIQRNMGASPSLRRPNNENKFFSASPNVSLIERPRTHGTGIFGQASSPAQVLNNSLQSNANVGTNTNPAFLQHLGSNKPTLIEAQNRSINDTCFASNLPGKAPHALPKVYRHHDR